MNRINQEHRDDHPLVSIWMVTYNHEDFIQKALESVLSQEVNFTYEIVIGEDCSTDSTRKVIESIQKQHPSKFNPIYHQQNVGASRNAYEYTLPACRGKYIAVLEGDDFWTNNNKLQRQVDFLEESPDYSACGHAANVFYEDNTQSERIFGPLEDQTFTKMDFLQHRKFHTSSLVFRRTQLTDYLPFPVKVISADRAIFALLSCQGKVYYYSDVMCCYRKGAGGISTKVTSKDLEGDLNMLRWIKSAATDFPIYRLKTFIHLTIYSYPYHVTYWHLIKHYTLFVVCSFSYFPKNLGDIKTGTKEFFRVGLHHLKQKK